jgi:hypothetical protein
MGGDAGWTGVSGLGRLRWLGQDWGGTHMLLCEVMNPEVEQGKGDRKEGCVRNELEEGLLLLTCVLREQLARGAVTTSNHCQAIHSSEL